jgi:hypothetical protein
MARWLTLVRDIKGQGAAVDGAQSLERLDYEITGIVDNVLIWLDLAQNEFNASRKDSPVKTMTARRKEASHSDGIGVHHERLRTFPS